MSKQSEFTRCLMAQLGYTNKIYGEEFFSPKQKELFPGLKRDLNMEIEDAAKSDDPLEACMERRGYKPTKTQVFQDAISAKLTADMFGKQEKLSSAEAMFQEQMQKCLDKLKNKAKLRFGGLKTDPLPPILAWIGGKTKFASKIISMMPEHKVYVEPFLGGGSVFFKKQLADVNVINDLDKDLINFYKGVRGDGGCEKIRACKMPNNRTQFNRAVESKDKDICNYLGTSKRGYGGDQNHPIFSPENAKHGHNAINFREKCDRYKDKLKQAKILNKDYKDVVKQYDSKDMLAYMDPPYIIGKKYKHSEISPEEVAKVVKSMKGKAIVSYNNHPRVRKAFAGLKFHKVKTRYQLQKGTTGTRKNVTELLITNF